MRFDPLHRALSSASVKRARKHERLPPVSRRSIRIRADVDGARRRLCIQRESKNKRIGTTKTVGQKVLALPLFEHLCCDRAAVDARKIRFYLRHRAENKYDA